MTGNKCFLDTNLMVYLYSNDPKSMVVENLIYDRLDDIYLSIQVLNELYNVLTRKKLQSKAEARSTIYDIIAGFRIYCIDEHCIKRAITINIQHLFSYWDSLIIASALESGCATLYSEDLQHQQVIDNTLTILNPFSVADDHF